MFTSVVPCNYSCKFRTNNRQYQINVYICVMEYIKSTKNYILIILIASISLNIWQHFGKLNTTQSEMKRIELEAKIEVLNDAIGNYEKHIIQLYELKQTPIYHKTIIKEKNETILNDYLNANDSTKLYIFTNKLRSDPDFRRRFGVPKTN